MYSDPNRQFSLLEKMNFVRICGTPAEEKAAAIIAQEIREIGFEPVLEAFQDTRFAPAEAKFAVTAPVYREFPVRGFFYYESMDMEDEMDFYYLEEMDPVGLKHAKGKFVLINSMAITADTYTKLCEAGVKGFLMMDGTVRDKREETDLHTGRIRGYAQKAGLLPALKIRMLDALELIKLQPQRVKFTCVSKEKTITSHNVVATVPGTDFPEEYIALGAHYDSTEFSYGVWDNAAGVVTILELMRYFKANPPRRTLKFIFFGAEEIGLRGSRAYLRSHPEEVEKLIFMFNADVGGNVIGSNGVMTTAEPDLDSYVKYAAMEEDFSCKIISDVMSSDSAMFNDYGIPSLSFMRMAPKGAGYMHTRYDMLPLLSPQALTPITEFMIAMAARMVNAENFPVSKTIPEKHKEVIFKRYRYEGCVTPDPKAEKK